MEPYTLVQTPGGCRLDGVTFFALTRYFTRFG